MGLRPGAAGSFHQEEQEISYSIFPFTYHEGILRAACDRSAVHQHLVDQHLAGVLHAQRHHGQAIADEFGAPYMHIHRADLHRILLNRCRQNPRISFHLNARVQSLDPKPNPKVALALTSGEIYEGDLIVGADGVHSLTRQVICERDDLAQNTGEAAYRALLPTSLMVDDPELKALVDTPELTTWMGPGRHVMGYCVVSRPVSYVIYHTCI